MTHTRVNALSVSDEGKSTHLAAPKPRYSACPRNPLPTSLHAGAEVSVIARWLGHEQTDTAGIYLHADLALKEKAFARTTPPDAAPGRYRPPDPLLAFLESL
jgi:hypothetical protein